MLFYSTIDADVLKLLKNLQALESLRDFTQ